jgi:HSP20 family protein
MNTSIINTNNKKKSLQQTDEMKSPLSLIDRFFDDTWDPFNLMSPSLFRTSGLGSVHTSFPKVDVEETENEIKVTANVPGIDPQKINVEVGDDYLSLSGSIEKENKDTNRKGKIYRYEREYGEFRRDFTLPARVKKDGIIAKSKNGVLTITLPKSEDAKTQQVKVEIE